MNHVTHPLSSAEISIFSTRNQQTFLYQEIQMQTAFWCIDSNSYKFFWVFKVCFKKYGYNFDDASKNGHCKSS